MSDASAATEVKDSFEFYDVDGIGYQVQVGLNAEKRRVIVLFVRNRDSRAWKKTLEMDIDLEAVYVDTQTDIEPIVEEPPPPPPPDPEGGTDAGL